MVRSFRVLSGTTQMHNELNLSRPKLGYRYLSIAFRRIRI